MSDIWTIPALKEHFEKLREADQEAVKVLANTFETRMNTTNEWRGALEDQSKDKATVQQVAQLKEQLDEVRTAVAAMGNRSGGMSQLAIMAGIVIAAVAGVNGIIFAIQGAAG